MIGIIPAGGSGRRMMPFKVWKELIHVGYKKAGDGDNLTYIPKIVSEYIIENMVSAEVSKIIMVLNEQKYDLVRFFGDGRNYGTSIVYSNQNNDSGITGMPVAIDTAYLWLKGKTVLMGMPDTIIEPYDSFRDLLRFHKETNADLTLGVFPTNIPQRLAPVYMDIKTGTVKSIVDKPKYPDMYNTWGIAVWSGKFTEMLHEYLLKLYEKSKDKNMEVIMSDIFMESINRGYNVRALFFEKGQYHDIGDINEFIATRMKIEGSIVRKDKIS